MNANRYELIIDATDVPTLLALDSHFTDVDWTPAPESSIMTYATFTATDAQLVAYCDAMNLPADEREEIFFPLD
jgi:hypothetical protein